MNKKTLTILNKTSLLLFAIALIFIVYNAILSLVTGYERVYGYYAAGAAFALVGLVLYLRPRLGVKFFTLLTGGVALYLGYTVLLALLAFGNPFFILGVLFNPLRFINYGAQTVFVIGLFFYLRSISRIFSTLKFAKDGTLDTRQNIPAILQKRARKWFIVSAIAVSIVGVFFLQGATKTFVNKVDPSSGNSHKIEQYLKDKYQEKFTLSKFEPSKQWRSSFESWTNLTAEATPVKNPNIHFKVEGCIENCDSDDAFSDRYVHEYWAYEQKPGVEAKLREVYGNLPEYELNIGLSGVMVSREFSGTPPSFESIRSNPKYKPSIHLTAYTPGTFTLENIREAEAKTRIMTNYIHSFGFSNFSFVYVMKDPIPPPESVYKGLSGVKQSDIRCSERLAIDEKKYPKMQAAANLKEFYSKGCSYETKNGSGGGMVRGRYPE